MTCSSVTCVGQNATGHPSTALDGVRLPPWAIASWVSPAMSARLHTWHCLRPCGQPWVCHPGPAAPIRSARQQRRHAVEIAVCKSPVPPTSHFPAGNVPSAKAKSRTCPPLPRPPPACEPARLSRRCLSRKARRRVKTPDVLTDFDSCKGADGLQQGTRPHENGLHLWRPVGQERPTP